MKDASYKRHIAKTMTWRVVGTLDTIILSWAITGDPFIGLQIGLAEVITKMILYFLHERIWFRFNLSKSGKMIASRKRHLAKTFTWRGLGTLDTMVLSWVITGSPFVGVQIGFAELITKMILYYIHERVWYRLDYGLTSRHKN